MDLFLWYLLSATVGYLLGSVPAGYLAGRSRGIDIREHGSGNIGATNVVRVLGKKFGYTVFVCDALKGLLAALAGSRILRVLVWHRLASAGDGQFDRLDSATQQLVFAHVAYYGTLGGIVAALACILGHNFPVWLKFRGGKGVATTVGVLLGLMPAALGVSAVVWIASFYLFRYVSLASMLGAAALPMTVAFLTARPGGPGLNNPLFWFSLIAAALIFWRHRANVQRLLNGTEPRFGRKPTPPPAV